MYAKEFSLAPNSDTAIKAKRRQSSHTTDALSDHEFQCHRTLHSQKDDAVEFELRLCVGHWNVWHIHDLGNIAHRDEPDNRRQCHDPAHLIRWRNMRAKCSPTGGHVPVSEVNADSAIQ